MRISSRVLGLGVLLLAAPLAAPHAEAAPPQPYHLAGGSGHDALQLADGSGRNRDWRDDHDGDWHDDDWDDDGRHRGQWRHGNPWGPGWNGPGVGRPHFAPRPLPIWVVEHRLRRQHVHPIGRITLRQGIYLVPVLDQYGRQVLLAVDPATAVILGRARHW